MKFIIYNILCGKKTSGKDIKNVNTEKGVILAMMNKKVETMCTSSLQHFFVGRAAALQSTSRFGWLPVCANV